MRRASIAPSAHVFNAREAKADGSLDHREVSRRFIHVGRKNLDPSLSRVRDVPRPSLIVIARLSGEESRHVLARKIRLQDRPSGR